MPAFFRRRNRRFAQGEYPAQAVDVRASDWANRVVANGGAIPSITTQIALGNFLIGLTTDGILKSMMVINCIVPDNLTASMTPLLVGPGFDPWITGLLSSDLSAAGITGNTGFSTKWANTGVVPGFSGSLNVLSDYGMTIYLSVILTGAGTQVDIGCINTTDSNSDQFIAGNIGGNSYANLTGSAGQLSAVAPGAGYFSLNRTASNALALYWANSTHTHSTLASNTSTANAGKTIPMYVLAVNNQVAASADYSGNTVSFVAIHHGLSSANSAQFFSRIQTLRQTLGGGFV